MAHSIPAGWHTVTPRIVARDPAALVDFITRVFEASGEFAGDAPSVIRIGDSTVMVSGAGVREPMTACLYVYVDDVDATYERAVKAGAETVEAPQETPYGDRRAMVTDAHGNTWQIATHHA